jgi:hypothetical protein
MRLQEFIHKFTEGSGSRFLQLVLVLFAMVGLAVWYDGAQFKNQSTIEGMDASQLARNLAEGRGFTTELVRPFSVHLIRQHREDKDPLLKTGHPDLAHAPLYPALLAGALKVNPSGWPDIRPEANPRQQFSIYTPDLWIAMVNQGLFFVAVWQVFRLGRRLFDDSVAWVSAAVFAGAEVFWKFSTSGQSTMLLVVLFLAVVEVLARIEPETKEDSARGGGWLVGMAAFAGVLTGLAGLTRYGFALLIFPVGFFLGALGTPKRFAMVLAAAGAFAVVLAPWVARNFVVSGTPFGTAGYALVQGTELFKDFQLERTLNPDLSLITGGMLWHKMIAGVREILEKELPRLGGSWVSAFFLVGVMVPFRKTVLLRLRMFLLVCLGLFIVAQALGRTGLSAEATAAESVGLTTENLLVVFAPLVFLFGVSLFFVLLEQFGMALPALRLIAVGVFVAVASAPLLFSLLMPVGGRLAYPPYYPPYIQEKCEWLPEDGLMMSDVPWASAWYGHRQSVWLSLKYSEEPTIRLRNDFAAMNQTGKPIRGLYLSPRLFKAVETDPLRKWVQREERGAKWEPYAGDWEGFVLLGAMLFREIPEGFSLSKAPFGPPFAPLPELFLTDSERPAGKTIKAQ